MINTQKYYRKFQFGGVTLSPEAQRILQVIQKNPQQAAQVLASAIQQGLGQAVEELAQADPQIGKLLAQMQGQTQVAKCGAKVKRNWLGSKVEKKSKGGKPCNCMTLHKIGGKLIEVDCTGKSVYRNR